MIRRPPRSTLDRSSAASDVYKRQEVETDGGGKLNLAERVGNLDDRIRGHVIAIIEDLSLIHISEPTRPY